MRLDTGRSAQKLRTRQALLAAARALVARGEAVTVAAAAAEAGISKATAYRYFQEADTLAMEAALDGRFAGPAEVVGDAAEVRERVHRVHRYLFEATAANERGFRLFLAKALEASAQEGAPLVRGGRRLPMYELALAPVRDRMAPAAFQDLVRALSGATGLEAWLALRDVCRLDAAEAQRIAALTVDAILDSMLPRG
ncbi:TetR family transcriptional regulator [Falsiroseomonas ponticola]|uniref:TetR family transcriptional regulator n=1 Tax=Falsiroseomonas ponticola TaxID=2786951 RepID=UPI00193209B7|nr:TetR family transcriptional regulator [Roseomonas ponticola]